MRGRKGEKEKRRIISVHLSRCAGQVVSVLPGFKTCCLRETLLK
jgi:hypothetical protein